MIYNRENGKKIIENERHAKTFFSRFKGLIFQMKAKAEQQFTCFS